MLLWGLYRRGRNRKISRQLQRVISATQKIKQVMEQRELGAGGRGDKFWLRRSMKASLRSSIWSEI